MDLGSRDVIAHCHRIGNPAWTDINFDSTYHLFVFIKRYRKWIWITDLVEIHMLSTFPEI